MKLAIIINEDTSYKCTGGGCLKAFFNKSDAFDQYDEETELVGFFHIGGNLDKKIDRLREKGVTTVHLSSCLRSKYEGYEELAGELAKDFDIVGYTHGCVEGKSRRAIICERVRE